MEDKYHVIVTEGSFEIYSHDQWLKYLIGVESSSRYEIMNISELKECAKTKTYNFLWLHLSRASDIKNILKYIFDLDKIQYLGIMSLPPKIDQFEIFEMIGRYPLKELRLGTGFDNSSLSKLNNITRFGITSSSCTEVDQIAERIPSNMKSLLIRLTCNCENYRCNIDKLCSLPLTELRIKQHVTISDSSYRILSQNTSLKSLSIDEYGGITDSLKFPPNLTSLLLESYILQNTLTLIDNITHIPNVKLRIRCESGVRSLLDCKNIKLLHLCSREDENEENILPDDLVESIERNVDLLDLGTSRKGETRFEPFIIRNRKMAQYREMINIAIIFSFLPPYVVLDIFDWLFEGKYNALSHVKKITTIQKIHRSLNKDYKN